MSLIATQDHLTITDEARRMLDARADPAAMLALLERPGAHHTGWWDMVREQGWTAVTVPVEHDGLGMSLIEAGLIAFEIGRTLAGAPFLTASLGAGRAILLGDAALQQRWLPALASGAAIGTVAFAEAQSVLATGCTLSDGRLSGVKHGVCAGMHADLAVVLAQEMGEPVLLAVALDGVERRGIASFDDSRGISNLHFEHQPATVLVRGDAARAAAHDVLAAQAVVTAYEQAGGAQAMLDRARDHALTRHAFGQPIGAFQSVKHRIAEMYALVELARAAALSAAVSDGTPEFIVAAAAARLQAGEAYDTCARDCVQIHGAMGVTWESGLHLHVRRARMLALEHGNALFWEDTLVNQLTGNAA